jgi:ubiquitin carboxyl-terminal hydrolase 22/27/51
MDDNKVTVASIADVLKQNAYLLFYGIRSIDQAK